MRHCNYEIRIKNESDRSKTTDQTFRYLHRRRSYQFRGGAGRDIRLPRGKRGREDHSHAYALRPIHPDIRRGPGSRFRCLPGERVHQTEYRIHEPEILPIRRSKVWENIRLFGGIYGLSKRQLSQKTDELLDILGLEKERNTLVDSLPLGWKQKLSFSVAIIHEPKIVFLDEPTGGVDPVTRRQFWELIYEAAARGITIFVTTHYMDEAEYCNRVSIMVDGKIEALDSPSALKRDFKTTNMNQVFHALARKATRGE